MTFTPQTFAMCAPLGFEEATWGIGLLVVIGIYAVIALVGYFLARDFYRFGRRGFSWLFAVVASGIFSGGGYYLAGPIGSVVVGAPFLVAFGLGRRRGQSSPQSTNEHVHRPSA